MHRLAYALLLAVSAMFTDGSRAAEAPERGAAAPPPYKQLRYDEDYRYLRDPDRATDFLDPIKYVPFTTDGTIYLSLGGEMRERYEYFHNSSWGDGPQDDGGYLLQRYMLHSDVHFGDHIRVFTQLKSGIESGRNGGPRPADEDLLDLHQAFVDAAGQLGQTFSITARVGRQELQYGTSRIVSARDGPSVRQSFDGVKAILGAGAWRIDAFITRPVETDRGIFDDNPDHDRAFWGVYAMRPLPLLSDGHVDLYYLGLDRQDATFDQGTAEENRHSFGLRLFGTLDRWDYNYEALGQVGTFGGGRIEAWTVASDTGVTLPLPRQPRFGLKANIASGDRNAETESLQTFNALFPRGAYFSDSALIGPANFIDVHPSIELEAVENLRIRADWDFFWRQSLADGLYGVAVNLVRSGQESSKRYIGSQAQVAVEWTFRRHITLMAAYAHFFAGPFLDDTGPGKDVDYVTTVATFKF